MNLPKRIAFFSIGMFLGIMLLLFFLGGKKASCSYLPTARTLKSIRKKDKVFSNEAILMLNKTQIDTSFLSKVLQDGEVLFSESTVKQDSCNIYVITGETLSKNKQPKNVKIWVKNCNKVATVLKAEVH
jgi:hypothetical protein